MNISNAFGTAATLDGNVAFNAEAGCERILHGIMDHERKVLETVPQLLRSDDKLVIGSFRQTAETVQELETPTKDVRGATGDLMITADRHTIQIVVRR